MKKRLTSLPILPAVLLLFFSVSGTSIATSGRTFDQKTTQKGTPVSKQANGTFEVKLLPQQTDPKTDDPTISSFALDKQFSGDLEGTSKGQMLAAKTDVPESAGYVAIERVTGKLNGRKGSFVLQHSGTMNQGAQSLTISVVPDSGTGELVGLAGKMTIKIQYGKHFYEFDYTLPGKD